MAPRDIPPFPWGDDAGPGKFTMLFGSILDAIGAAGPVDRVLFPGQGYTGPIVTIAAGLGGIPAMEDVELYAFQILQTAGVEAGAADPVVYTCQRAQVDVAATATTLAQFTTASSALVELAPGQVVFDQGESIRWHRVYTGDNAADVAPECCVACLFGPRRNQTAA